jgi:opacity protein-like surface antigen
MAGLLLTHRFKETGMTTTNLVRCLGTAAALVIGVAPAAVAADPKVEIGTTMSTVTVGLGDNEGTIVGIPAGGFGLMNSGVYASIFVGPFVAVEPQVGLVWVSSDGDSHHLANVTGQVDFFPMGSARSSPYVFGAVGILDTSDSDTNPKTYAAGAGYRFAITDSLAFRVDGRYVHFTEGGGNAVMFGVSIGGVFGR